MKLHPNLGLLLMRIALGGLFVFAGLMKFFKFGYGNFVKGGVENIPPYMPHKLGMAYLYAVPFAETIVGAMLIIGLCTRTAAVLTALMLLSFMMAVTGFTDHGGPHASLIYLCFAVGIALEGPGLYSVDAIRSTRRRAA
jgi:uncharacterized membrane protein YphA (DoxX/SURF4 family)